MKILSINIFDFGSRLKKLFGLTLKLILKDFGEFLVILDQF